MASRIADLALRRFRVDGFAGTSVADLAIALDVSKAAVYYHYRSKAALLHRLVDPLLDAIDAFLETHTAAAASVTVRDLVAAYLATLTAHRPVVALVAADTAVINHPEIGPRVQAQNQRLRTLLVGPDADAPAALRVEAALGALWRPLVADLDFSLNDGSHQRTLIDAALAALAAPAPSPDRQPLG